MHLPNLRLNCRTPHCGVSKSIGRDAKWSDSRGRSDEPVSGTIGETPSTHQPILFEHRLWIVQLMTNQKWEKRFRPAKRAIDSRDVCCPEKINNFIVGDSKRQMS
ncbi:hypothetical protein GCM10009628_39760 [Paeniglutamicibacter kerguelensis]